MATDAQKRASAKYDASHTVQIHLKLNTTTDSDILAQLESVAKSDPSGKQGYIKSLIRADIAKNKQKKSPA